MFEIDSKGIITLAKNASIREVAVYNGAIEYDIVYNTNNFGSVDNVDYEANIGKCSMGGCYAFVGDSFTTGCGGFAWVQELRDRLLSYKPDIQIYTFGLPGGGLWHFFYLLQKASENNIELTDIVILAISDDMRRHYYLCAVENDKVYGYPRGATDKKAWNPIATIIDKNASEEEILNHVNALLSQKIKSKKTVGGIKFFLNKSIFLRSIERNLDRLIARPSPNYNVGYASLIKMRRFFPKAKIYFIHLPQKNEVRSGNYINDIKDVVESLGIEYYPALSECEWSMAMYHKHDEHPNKIGYTNISNCVEKYLFKQ